MQGDCLAGSLSKGLFEHVNRKWGPLPLNLPWRHQICIAKFLFSYIDNLREILNQSTAQWC